MNKKSILTIFEQTGLSPAESIVYTALLSGAQTAQEIMKITDEKRPTVYYCLNSLEKRGLLSKTGKELGAKFQVESIDNLSELVTRNISKQNNLLEDINKVKEVFTKKDVVSKTVVSHYEGLQAINTAIFSTLYTKEKLIRSVVPEKNFFHQSGKKFVLEYVTEKKRRNVKTKALWESIPQKSVFEEFYKEAEVRKFSQDMISKFDSTLFVYDNKTLYISPKNDLYAVLIQSDSHAQMMKSVFENMWINAQII